MNKTAIQWFVDQLPVRILNAYSEEIETALEMEQQQLKTNNNNMNSAYLGLTMKANHGKQLTKRYNELLEKHGPQYMLELWERWAADFDVEEMLEYNEVDVDEQETTPTLKRGSDEASVGTSFHGHTIMASINELKQIFGEPDFATKDFESGNVTHEWIFENADGAVFTLYDYKEYRDISADEQIVWHIGAKSDLEAAVGQAELVSALHSHLMKN